MLNLITLEQTIENHRKLWNGIAELLETEEMIKKYYEETKDFFGCIGFLYFIKETAYNQLFATNYDSAMDHPENYCFLCEYVDSEYIECPMYDVKHPDVSCLNGKYSEFTKALYTCKKNNSYEEAIIIAKEIANLPIINPLYLKEE